jgi:hypothetical protein
MMWALVIVAVIGLAIVLRTMAQQRAKERERQSFEDWGADQW